MKLDKMFALDQAFMFRFEAEPGQPENENHKIIPTYRALKKLGKDAMIQLMRSFLGQGNGINWKPFDFGPDSLSLGDIYWPKKYGDDIGISPSTVSANGVTRKVVWVMTKLDIEEVNGLANDGQNRVKVC